MSILSSKADRSSFFLRPKVPSHIEVVLLCDPAVTLTPDSPYRNVITGEALESEEAIKRRIERGITNRAGLIIDQDEVVPWRVRPMSKREAEQHIEASVSRSEDRSAFGLTTGVVKMCCEPAITIPAGVEVYIPPVAAGELYRYVMALGEGKGYGPKVCDDPT